MTPMFWTLIAPRWNFYSENILTNMSSELVTKLMAPLWSKTRMLLMASSCALMTPWQAYSESLFWYCPPWEMHSLLASASCYFLLTSSSSPES